MAKYGLDDKLAIFLEEDHVVTPDFLHTLQLMEENRTSICPECEILALGTYPKSFGNYEQQIAKLNIEVWFSSKNNIGMVMDRKLWRKVQNCSQFFCSYNDYNWDWTMLQLSLKCLPKPLQVIYPVAPRVIHIGDCGVHWTKCDGIDPALDLAVKLFERAKDSFFPSELEVAHVGKQLEREPSAPNGGWGDSRDRILCELNTHPADANATEVIEEARRAKG